MSNPVLDIIHQHGSVRHYKPDPVTPGLIENIVIAGQRASTSSNLQMYSVVVTTNEAKRQQLMALCGDQKHIGQAPVFMTWCADLSRLVRVCQYQGYDDVSDYFENAMQAIVDVAIFMQNAALAAESYGLGMCYIGGIRNNPQTVIDLLSLPNLVFPVSGMTLGWPQKPAPIRPRLPLDAVLHWEEYNNQDESYLRDYDQVMLETGIYKGRQVTGQAEQPEYTYGWMEHSARRASQVHRSHLRQVFEDAGFGLK